MRAKLTFFGGFLAIFFFSLESISLAKELTNFGIEGRELAQLVRERENGDDFSAQGRMELIDKNSNTRVRDFLIYRKDQGLLSKQVVRFTSPADIAGTAFLSIEQDGGETEQILYLPALKRTRRIVSTQKGNSFVNTDFTYEDMERRGVDGWDHQIVSLVKIGAYECYVLESIPGQSIKTEYSLIKSWVAKDINVPMLVEFYDKKNRLYKKYEVNKLEKIKQVWTEIEVTMFDLVNNHKTLMKFKNIDYDSGLSDGIFTERSLERW